MESANISDSLGRRQSRADSILKLVPIEAGYFYPGLYVDFSIYIRMGKTTTLLCSNVVLNDALIEKIDTAEDMGNLICVTKDSYKKIILNAAKVAEEQGSDIDWDGVKDAADNPQSVEEYISEAEGPVKMEGLDNIPDPSKQAKKNRKDIRQAAQTGGVIVMMEGQAQAADEEESGELEEETAKINEYFLINEDVDRLMKSCDRNYTVKPATVMDLAERIVYLVRTTPLKTIFKCNSSLREGENYLLAHTQNVATLNAIIGQWLELSHSERLDLAVIGLMHDMGKQQISNRIMKKAGKLTNEEFDAIKRHSIHSYNIAVASGITGQYILSGIRHHHEKLNGTGYPDGISGEAISFSARITAISDIYDAMVSKKNYGNGHSPLDIMAEFAEMRGAELDSKAVGVILDNFEALFANAKVQLSNGQTGVIRSLNSSDYAHPIVEIGRESIKTTKYLKVVSIEP